MKEEVKEYVTEFLKAMQTLIPMSPGKHNLTINDDDLLVSSFIIGDMWHSWIFEEEIILTPSELAKLIYDEAINEGIIKL